MDDDMTYAQRVAADNTWKKHDDATLEYCDICDKDTMQTYVKGSTVWDSYSYTICHDKGHDEKKRLNDKWLNEQRIKFLNGEKGTIYDKQGG